MERSIRMDSRQRWLCLAVLAAAALASGAANAVPAPSAPATAGSSYTVSYQPCSGCSAHWLEERAENGSWTYKGQSPLNVIGKPSGTYYYRVGNEFTVYDGYFGYYWWTEYSAEVRVTVASNVAPLDPLTTQLGYRYETRYGDGNGDGRLDVLLNRVSGGVSGSGVVETVLLLQGSGGQLSPSVPSASLAAVAKSWPTAPIQTVLNDFNADGFVDVLLKGVSSIVSGGLNQIVFSPASPFTYQPLGMRAVDDGLKRFVAQSRAYYADSGYFDANAPLVLYYVPVPYCYPTNYYDYYNYACYWTTYWYPVVYRDYSVFDSTAVSTASTEASIEARSISREQGVASIEQAYESVIGVQIGGREDLRGLAGEQGSFDEPTYRRGLELFLAILGIGDANAQEIEGRDAARRPDTVYITGRRVLGFLPLHTALEFGGSTLSAFDSDLSVLGDGRLVSIPNAASDRPPLMMTLGTVSSSLGSTLYWARLVAADAGYDDRLPYDAVPSAGAGGYNSNGYSHGLVQATAGVPSINMTRFVGGEKPVPASAFH